MNDSIYGSESTPGWPLRFLNGAAKHLRIGKYLNEESLSSAAIKKTGLTDFGDPHYRQALSKLIEPAKNDARLHLQGAYPGTLL